MKDRTRQNFGCQNSGTKIDLVRTCFKDGKWTVARKYIIPFCQRKKRAMDTTEKVDGQCKWGQGDKEISFPTTWPLTIIQNRIEWKMIEERKEGLDKSNTCCYYGLSPSRPKPVNQTWIGLFVFVSVSSCCSLLFCNFTLLHIYSAVCIVFFRLRFFPGNNTDTLKGTPQILAGIGVGRGVYPYLPMATNAPWSILGGMNKKFNIKL